MKLHPWIASALVALSVASCGENGGPPPAQSHGSVSAGSTSATPVVAKGGAGAKPRTTVDDTPVAPKDAEWTIFCDSVQGPGHVEQAGLIKSRLAQMSGMSGWYIIHNANDSTIYYGFYHTLDDPAEKARAARDRAKIAALTDQLGNPLLRGDQMVRVIAPDPQAPADWNLVNTPKNAYWTIEIMTFADNPKRKEAAVEAVRAIRATGEKDCYFYHGETASSVCIGAWPREAVAEQGTGTDKKGENRDDGHNLNPNQSLFVFGDVAPSNVAGQVLDPATGKPMTVEGKKLDIVDPDMKQKVAKYPHHAVNYEYHGVQNGNQTFPDPSVLVVIPHSDSAAGEDDWRLNGGFEQPAGSRTAQQPAPPTSPGDSVLRSFGDR